MSFGIFMGILETILSKEYHPMCVSSDNTLESDLHMA